MRLFLTIVCIAVSALATSQERFYHSAGIQEAQLSERRDLYTSLSNESLADTINWQSFLLVAYRSDNLPWSFFDLPMKKYLEFDDNHSVYMRIAVAVETLAGRGDQLNIKETIELIRGFWRLEEYEKAIRWSTISIDKLNENTHISDRDRELLYLFRARSKAGIEDYYGAISDYQALSENCDRDLHESCHIEYFLIGYYYLKLGKYSDAVTNLSKTIELGRAGTHIEALYYRGISYLNTNNLEAACKDLSTAAQYGNEHAKDLIETRCN
jgi:tetratricopeptide (TPR) repeat protein